MNLEVEILTYPSFGFTSAPQYSSPTPAVSQLSWWIFKATRHVKFGCNVKDNKIILIAIEPLC